LNVILDAANRAPSAHNQQSWRFVVLRGEKKHELSELVSTRAGDFPRPSSILLRMAARSIISAPVVVGVANTGELIRHGSELFQVDKEAARDFFRTMEIQSSAAAVENLLLAATSMGIGSVWLGILFLMKREVLTFLGEPAGEFMAVVPLGYPAKTTEGPKKRPLESLIRYLD
jgi:nitroreductase